MRHLASYWAPVPPQRQHVRHRVKHRVAVLPGLVNAFVVFSPEFGGKPMGLPLESWIVENLARAALRTIQDIKATGSRWVHCFPCNRKERKLGGGGGAPLPPLSEQEAQVA